MIRQGDILLKKIDKIEGVKIAEKSHILAYGEMTGHHHTLEGDAIFYKNKDSQTLIQVKSEAELKHQEHDNITIPKGNYIMIPQREYDLVEGVRKVMD